MELVEKAFYLSISELVKLHDIAIYGTGKYVCQITRQCTSPSKGDVLGFKSHSLHRTNREKGRVKFHFSSKSSADWMKNGVSGTLTSFFCHISFVGIYISSFGNSR